jgi:methyl-accepting chemotaxis protein
VNNNVVEIKKVADNQHNAMQEASIGINGIDHLNKENTVLAESLSTLATRFAQQSGNMRDSMEVFKIQTGFSHPKHEMAFNLAQQTAKQISIEFEQAISKGTISETDLFTRTYTPIANTDPVKYSTPFDTFCDRVLPTIQEQNLEQAEFATYLIATDTRGYVPTHNNKFCKPLTGNPKTDLVTNRTKRIFTDRVGQASGANVQKYILLTYRRDTSEVLTDLSCPIYVNGKHWGGIRCGYPL